MGTTNSYTKIAHQRSFVSYQRRCIHTRGSQPFWLCGAADKKCVEKIFFKICAPARTVFGRYTPHCAQSILSCLVVYNRIQAYFRCVTSLFFDRYRSNVCLSYLDGLCVAWNSWVSFWAWKKDTFRKKLQCFYDINKRRSCLFWDNLSHTSITLTTVKYL